MDTTRGSQLPSGWEVESRGGFRGRLDTLKSRGLTKVHDIQRVVADRRTLARSSMRTNSMKWAGIATATGFALGLVGLIAQARNKRKNAIPTLVIIEARC